MISFSTKSFFCLFFIFSNLCIAQPIEKNTDGLVFHIAVLYWSMDIPGQVAMRDGVEYATNIINKKASKNKLPTIKLYPYVAGNGSQGIENQIRQFDQVIEQRKMDLIIVQPTDNAALVKSLQKANLNNIPVIAYDQYINEGELTSFITSNNYQAGYLDGEYIASKFDNAYDIKLILVEYPYVSSTVERVDGFIDALVDNHQSYKIINSYRAVEPLSGSKAGKQILLDFPEKNSIDVVFTVNDGGGLSVVEELSNAGRYEIMVATIDGDPLSLKNLIENQLTVIDSAQFCKPLGEEALYTAYNFLNGNAVKAYKLMPVFPVTKETVLKYPSWNGPIPQSFKKPWPSKTPFWSKQIHAPQK